jgi:hypothetical protein
MVDQHLECVIEFKESGNESTIRIKLSIFYYLK